MDCKKYLLLLVFYVVAKATPAQTITTLEGLKAKIAAVLVSGDNLPETKFNTIENMILNEPGIYNDLWGRVNNTFRNKSDQFLLKNLKIDFKTFQGNDSNKTSLGFSYKWNYEINKKKNTDYQRSEFLAKITAEGNVAFKKNLNPLDFQSAKLDIGTSGFLGGTVNKLDAALTADMNKINQQLAAIEDEDELANSPLWNDITKAMAIKNQYHYNFSATGGWEGKQDFSTSQLTYGAQLRFSAKAYSDKNPLAQLNILDYPFALIRYITGTDKSINPYGAALPIVTMGIDMVNPTKDSVRTAITGNEKQFTRFRFEAGFRTLLASINKTTMHFNAAYRYFSELNAASAIRLAKLNSFSYFTCSVTAADTYFFSYSYGKLPFDRTDNAVYELGFKFNL
ncbi:MAG: hypothetical protein IPP72_10970 [Chitinophagaceae bacterium]|nr:hypothetical protein [Chitinophagaceae bacterium]